MTRRRLLPAVQSALTEAPAVALLGQRQVGKTTLALELARVRPSVYLDLESAADRARLAEPEPTLPQHEDKLVILDEIQRVPQLFRSLRGLIDAGRGRGRGKGRFLVLGPASMDLLPQSGESLAGRIRYLELAPVDAGEAGRKQLDSLWLRGGFPESLLAASHAASVRWRSDFIRTYLERDIPQLGPRIPAETLRGLWTMLAHQQGGSPIAAAPSGSEAHFFRTAAGAEIDLLIKLPGRRKPWAIEIKRGIAPRLDQGFHLACETVGPGRRLVVYGGAERFPIAEGVEGMPLADPCEELRAA